MPLFSILLYSGFSLSLSASVSLADWLKYATERLRLGGFDAPRREARLLAAAAMDMDSGQLMARTVALLDNDEMTKLESFLQRRLDHEPLSRIIGKRGFWNFEVSLCTDTLDPRADTETLVIHALDRLQESGLRAPCIIDVGTGSGCILLALLLELPEATGLGVDISPRAARQAYLNARSLGLENRSVFIAADLLSAVGRPVDLIVSNPPYIRTDVIAELEKAVRDYDPVRALDGGEDGLEFYRKLCRAAPPLLNPGGVLAVEIGYDQEREVTELMNSSGLVAIEIRRDLGGNPRTISGRSPGLPVQSAYTLGEQSR